MSALFVDVVGSTELARKHDERLLVSGDIVDCAGGEEPARWCAGGEVVLRGRERPTRIAVPARARALASRSS